MISDSKVRKSRKCTYILCAYRTAPKTLSHTPKTEICTSKMALWIPSAALCTFSELINCSENNKKKVKATFKPICCRCQMFVWQHYSRRNALVTNNKKGCRPYTWTPASLTHFLWSLHLHIAHTTMDAFLLCTQGNSKLLFIGLHIFRIVSAFANSFFR